MKKYLIYLMVMTAGLCGLSSCSEDTEEDEYANWSPRNDAFFASLEDSLSSNPSSWLKIKKYSLDQNVLGNATDYVYAKVIENGDDDESPMLNDSVRVIYQGRLIPTATYPQGKVFDSTVYGDYDIRTSANAKFLMTGLVDGWTSALLRMHRRDRWRLYIPSQLGYGENTSSTIPAHSVLIFDITLLDFSHSGTPLQPYSARKR